MSSKRSNQLAAELSPYLQQHADNPVGWLPWGAEALARAVELDRPIFLSIGYAACHWCHVMARESFSDEHIAAVLEEHFVCIKVDREELPEVDELYMKAVQSLTGSGGWPLSVFLTPQLSPFFGGTYFPPRAVHGRPGFLDVVSGIAHGWSTDRERACAVGAKLLEELSREARLETRVPLPADVFERSLSALQADFDPVHGGFGGAPKFPHATDLRLCLRHGQRLGPSGGEAASSIAVRSLEQMAAGGLWDQLAGGFHRYCVDDAWRVPHFEKMLCDTSLLIPAYLEAFLVTGKRDLARVAREACAWMLAELRLEGGGFASSLDADSEGEEGRFYSWTPDELTEVLGTQGGYRAQEWFGVEEQGHLDDGRSVLHRPMTAEEVAGRVGLETGPLGREIEQARGALLIARRRRPAPTRDDKVLCAWNGLAISALAQAHQILGDGHLLEAARAAARFLLGQLRDPDGGLLTCWRGGRASGPAGLDAYAFVVQGLLDLHESDFDPGWLMQAVDLAERAQERFADPEQGGYFQTDAGRPDLLMRLRSPHDGALPAASSVHALNLLRLAELTGRRELAQRAEGALQAHGALVGRYPQGFSQLLLAADFLSHGPVEVVIAGEPEWESTRALLRAVRRTFRPGRVVALAHGEADRALQPILAHKQPAQDGRARAYPCRGYACDAPIDDPDELASWLVQSPG